MHVTQLSVDNGTKGLLLLCRLAPLVVNKALGASGRQQAHHAALHQAGGWWSSLFVSPPWSNTHTYPLNLNIIFVGTYLLQPSHL